MLEIVTEGVSADLMQDTEINITYENPFMATDGVPVPYSLTYKLPLSVKNRKLFGFPDRPTSNDGFKKLPSRIMFNGVEIASGQQTVAEVTNVINVNFNAAVLPKNVRNYLNRLPLGKLKLGVVEMTEDRRGFKYYTQTAVRNNYNNFLLNALKMVYPAVPFMFAPTMGITSAEWKETTFFRAEYTQHRSIFINGYFDGYIFNREYTMEGGIHLNKILPVFQIGIILDIVLDDKVTNNIFKTTEWKRLMLISKYHPEYQTDNNSPVYDIDRNTNEISVTYADFMPQVSGNEFLTQILKLPCATLYVKGGEYSIELKKDILERNIVRDWNSKIIGIPSISQQSKQQYKFGYSNDEGSVPADRVLTPVNTIYDMYVNAENLTYESEDDLLTYSIASTGQVIETAFDPESGNKCKYKVLRQEMNMPKIENDECEEDIEVFDNSFNGTVPTTNLRYYFRRDIDSKVRFYYMPEIEPEKNRPNDLVVGLYYGMDSDIYPNNPGALPGTHPYLTHCNYGARGNRLGDLSLSANGEDGVVNRYHKEFKSWIEKDKLILKAEVLLSPEDLNKLDLRDKFHINGKIYFIKTLSVTITVDRIKPAEVEFIEA